MYYGDHGYSTCAVWSWSLTKRLFCHLKPKLLEIAWNGYIQSKEFSLFLGGGREGGRGGERGGFSARFPMGCSMMHEIWFVKLCHVTRFKPSISKKAEKRGRAFLMHEIWFGKVMSHHTIRAEYLTKRQKKAGAFRPFCSKLSFCRLNTVVFLYGRLIMNIQACTLLLMAAKPSLWLRPDMQILKGNC